VPLSGDFVEVIARRADAILFVLDAATNPMSPPRMIPSIDRLIARPRLRDAIALHGRGIVVEALRRAAEALRATLAADSGATGKGSEVSPDDEGAARAIEDSALQALDAALRPSLRRAINATGVIVHTNLGRAPLAAAAAAAAADIGAAYSNLEYDLDAGARGHRHVHAERLLVDLTGAEAALIVNNNAAATLVVLAALAAGREVVASRGELVEIGGGFRVPDVMAQSGALLREVGTTNRTRAADYASAIGDRTALLLRVHPSNFAMSGFTERPPARDLVALARRFDLPVFEDLGSGWLGLDDMPPSIEEALREEPAVRRSVADGVDVVSFSGDKLLGGPQAGIVVGRAALIDRIRRHPLMRALRADKLTYAALEATLALWRREPARREIPVYRMLALDAAAIDRRALALADQLAASGAMTCRIVDGASTTGGGSAPGSALPTRLLLVSGGGRSAAALERALRAHDPPIVARVQDDALAIDLRTVEDVDDVEIGLAILSALK
jgi:L-seryl-tRNA(Ser) seleniumtransferase